MKKDVSAVHRAIHNGHYDGLKGVARWTELRAALEEATGTSNWSPRLRFLVWNDVANTAGSGEGREPLKDAADRYVDVVHLVLSVNNLAPQGSLR